MSIDQCALGKNGPNNPGNLRTTSVVTPVNKTEAVGSNTMKDQGPR